MPDGMRNVAASDSWGVAWREKENNEPCVKERERGSVPWGLPGRPDICCRTMMAALMVIDDSYLGSELSLASERRRVGVFVPKLLESVFFSLG